MFEEKLVMMKDGKNVKRALSRNNFRYSEDIPPDKKVSLNFKNPQPIETAQAKINEIMESLNRPNFDSATQIYGQNTESSISFRP